MKKRQKRKLIKYLLILLIVICSYVYRTYFNEDNLKKTPEDIEYRKDKPVIVDKSNLTIHYIDVGQADSILVTQNNEYALIDAGNNEDGELLVDYLKELGITKFKYVIGTHAHEDHIGGMDDIIDKFEIEHFYMPDAITTTKTFEDVLDALEKKQLAFETPNINREFNINDSKFKVLYVGTDERDLNNTSIVLKLTYKNTSYLFMGDATSEIEKNLVNNGTDLKSDVLKVGHHGSQYSSSAVFLKKVKPKYAIIPVGKNNTYDHPKQITLDKLLKLNTKIYRTDQQGTIILTSDGENISVDSIKTNTNG